MTSLTTFTFHSHVILHYSIISVLILCWLKLHQGSHRHLVVWRDFFSLRCRCVRQQDSEDEEPDEGAALELDGGLRDNSSVLRYVPEDFANFESYNATLESQDGVLSCRSEPKGLRCGGADREVPRSPTTSSCTSGYFSHSASNATLSDMTFGGSESSDHLSITSRETADPHGGPSSRGCSQAKGVLASEQPQRPRASLAISVPQSKDRQEADGPASSFSLSSSLEFTDFKSADDSVGEAGLAHFTEEWQRRNGRLDSTADGETPLDVSGVVCMAASTICNKHRGASDCDSAVPPCTATVCTSVKDGDAVPDKVPPPSTGSPPTAPPSSPAPRAGGEPPIQEPAQGDLPHGSPCPSPNPSSAEPSGDSSGDESAPAAQLPDWMAPGEQVWVGKRRGTVHYVGGVEFAKGIWVGVKLDMAVGECLSFFLFDIFSLKFSVQCCHF